MKNFCDYHDRFEDKTMTRVWVDKGEMIGNANVCQDAINAYIANGCKVTVGRTGQYAVQKEAK